MRKKVEKTVEQGRCAVETECPQLSAKRLFTRMQNYGKTFYFDFYFGDFQDLTLYISVASAGLKPATLRTGIWCSIQLSYEAVYAKSFAKLTTKHLTTKLFAVQKNHLIERKTVILRQIIY